MHYYSFNIGDYRKDTVHLSRLEHSIYRDLIDWYYLEETPIPKETQSVIRRLRLASEDEKTALENVLADFFMPSDVGFRHLRIDAEIAEYHAQCEKNKVNGKKGGRPKGKKTQSVSSGLPVGTQTDARDNPNQEPLTNNQEPITKNTRLPAIAAPDGVTESVWTDFVQLRKDKKAKLTQTALDGIRAEAAKAGWSLESALRESCARGWAGFKADWVADKQPNSQPQKQAKSFAQQDREAGVARWEELTGRTHPDRQQCAQHTGNVIEATTKILEIEQ